MHKFDKNIKKSNKKKLYYFPKKFITNVHKIRSKSLKKIYIYNEKNISSKKIILYFPKKKKKKRYRNEPKHSPNHEASQTVHDTFNPR